MSGRLKGSPIRQLQEGNSRHSQQVRWHPSVSGNHQIPPEIVGALKKRAVGASPLMAARTFAMTMPTCIASNPVKAGLTVAVASVLKLCASRHLGLHSLQRRGLKHRIATEKSHKSEVQPQLDDSAGMRQPSSGNPAAPEHCRPPGSCMWWANHTDRKGWPEPGKGSHTRRQLEESSLAATVNHYMLPHHLSAGAHGRAQGQLSLLPAAD